MSWRPRVLHMPSAVMASVSQLRFRLDLSCLLQGIAQALPGALPTDRQDATWAFARRYRRHGAQRGMVGRSSSRLSSKEAPHEQVCACVRAQARSRLALRWVCGSLAEATPDGQQCSYGRVGGGGRRGLCRVVFGCGRSAIDAPTASVASAMLCPVLMAGLMPCTSSAATGMASEPLRNGASPLAPSAILVYMSRPSIGSVTPRLRVC